MRVAVNPYLPLWWRQMEILSALLPLCAGNSPVLCDLSSGLYAYVHDYKRTSDTDLTLHDDVIKWKHFPRYWPFVRGIHRSPVNSPHKGQWRGALVFSLICACINAWVNHREAGDLRRHRTHYDVNVMEYDTNDTRAIDVTENVKIRINLCADIP